MTGLLARPPRTVALAVLGAVGLSMHCWTAHPSGPGPSVGALLLPMGLAGVAFARAAVLVLRQGEAGGQHGGGTVPVVIVFAALFRLAALPAPPLLDDDIHRYLWDGKVWASGVDPYLYAPDSFFLEPLRDENHAKIGFPYLRTIYPPLAQALFRLAHGLAPGSATALKALLMTFDAITIALLMLLLSRLGLPRERVLLYAWNPLVIKELANSGHVDAAAVCLLVASCALAVCRRPAASAAMLGLAALVKLFPLVALPALWRRWAPAHVVLCAGTFLIGYVPFFEQGDLIVEAMGVYATHWEYNDSVFAILSALAEWGGAPAGGLALRVTVGLGVALLAVRAGAHSDGSDRGTLRAVAIAIAALLLASPTVQPWYVVWLVPFLCLFPWSGWLAFTGTVMMSYAFHIQGQDQWWIRPIEYAPLILWFGSRPAELTATTCLR